MPECPTNSGSYLSHQNTRLGCNGAALLLRQVSGERAAVAQRDQRRQGPLLREAHTSRGSAVVQAEVQCASALPKSMRLFMCELVFGLADGSRRLTCCAAFCVHPNGNFDCLCSLDRLDCTLQGRAALCPHQSLLNLRTRRDAIAIKRAEVESCVDAVADDNSSAIGLLAIRQVLVGVVHKHMVMFTSVMMSLHRRGSKTAFQAYQHVSKCTDLCIVLGERGVVHCQTAALDCIQCPSGLSGVGQP